MRILIFLLLSLVFASIWEEKISGEDVSSFVQIAKFCGATVDNDGEAGSYFDIWLTFSKLEGNFSLALFDDDNIENGGKSEWDQAFEKKCEGDWRSIAKKVIPISNQRRDFHDRFTVWQMQRPHFWFLALIGCDNHENMDVDYKVHAVQAQMSNWNNEFSFELHGINSLYLTYCILYIILTSIQVFAVKQYEENFGAHHIVKLLTFSIVVQALSCMVMFVNYSHFAAHGTDIPNAKVVSQQLSVIAITAFILLLLLMSQGWTINNNKIVGGRYILFGGTIFYFLQVALVLWKYHYSTNQEVRYLYSSAPSILVAFLYFCVGAVFIYFSQKSWRGERDSRKEALFKTIALIFSVFFFQPVISLVTAIFLSPWVRDICVAAGWETSTFIFFSTMTYLLWPSRAKNYFEMEPIGVQNSLENNGEWPLDTDYVRLQEGL